MFNIKVMSFLFFYKSDDISVSYKSKDISVSCKGDDISVSYQCDDINQGHKQIGNGKRLNRRTDYETQLLKRTMLSGTEGDSR